MSWRKPEPDEYQAAIDERNRPKVGRMALRGAVEQIDLD